MGYIGPLLRSFPVFVNLTVLPCPLGFFLSGNPPQCTCDIRLTKNDILCNLSSQVVLRSGTEWVNASYHNSVPRGLIVNKYCPNNYCRRDVVHLNLIYPDTQCAFNHSGILCGGCQSGLSLALGSAQCLSCSNDYLALLILFALAGFVLVFFIKVLNLTIAQGTLNGLIFYTNVVWANKSAWLPAEDTNILTIFVAWFNLDFGIETCFFDGLDAYWKTWLQFVFPLYIWAIVILIIVLSRYFSTVARLFGRNSVPILGTLLLLSYSKLLRTVISILQYSTLDYPQGPSAIVWSFDGNVPYVSAKRAPLILVAVIVILFLWLPYTGLLLFAQCLQKSNFRVAVILMKLKPFLDAYFGPLKDKHRYWIGLLLLVRGILFLVYAATPTSMDSVTLLATTAVIACLLVYPYTGWVNKTIALNLLENSMFLNLILLSAGTFHIEHSGGSQAALAYISLSIAFAQFVAVVLFHAITMLMEFRVIKRCICNRWKVLNHQQAGQDQQEYERIPDGPEVNREGVVQLRVTLDDYREPVLKYVN